MNNILKQTKGITLIALVITIIVLLILAGVTITSLTGENGLLQRASDARDETIVEQEIEQLKIEAFACYGGNSEVDFDALKTNIENHLKVSSVTNSGSNLQVKYSDTNNVYTISKKGEVKKKKQSDVPEDIFVALYNDGTLVFSNKEEALDSTKVTKTYGNIKDISFEYSWPEWADENYENITQIKILNKIVPTSTASWFSGLYNVTKIENIENIDTSNVTEMRGMFQDCASLTSIDVSSFDTSNVIDMAWMFYMDDDNFMKPCLNEIKGLSSFDTKNVTDMSYMFRKCKITEIDLSSFDTSKVTSIENMFSGCSNLQRLDLSSFDTSKVTSIVDMFYGCDKLTTIYGKNWDTSSISYTHNFERNIFNGCTSLVGGAGTTYDSNHTDYTYAHIDGGTSNPGYFTSK